MAETLLTSHHVGGRAGTRNFPILEYFEEDVTSVFYEADKSAISQIKKVTSALPSKTIVLSDCLSGKSGKRKFYIRSDRYSSSLYPTLSTDIYQYNFNAQFGWDSDPEAKAVTEILTLDTITLDEVLLREDGKVPSPDFLSLDTEGSELEILKGGQRVIYRSVVAIMTEVSFVRHYKKQPLFGEVTEFLRKIGFDLASLEVFKTESFSDRTPIGLRGSSYPRRGEALFLRRETDFATLSDQTLSKLKKAFICFYYGFYDETFQILSTFSINELKAVVETDPNNANYLKFLFGLKTLADGYAPVFPVKYSDILSKEQGKKRFIPEDNVQLDFKGIAQKYFAGNDDSSVCSLIKSLEVEEYLSVEYLAHRFGFVDQADDLRSRRLEQIESVKRWLNIT
ncbi:MAG: hypothetical protein CMM58_06075 [Rhodospirillaceae bacterium]|nr:hypothetical protein [Rhodospirillaceae bacterium]|tara:strand:- start:473 stop:1660 length:1188 start_codon:yes stop_codon:yes gene_type:complete